MFEDQYFRDIRRERRAQAGGFRQRERELATGYGNPRHYPSQPEEYPPGAGRGIDPTARNLDMLGTRRHDTRERRR